MKLDAALALVGNDYGPTPCMLANIIFRFILNLGAALACWVPLRLFHKNGELAGTSMVLATAILNFFYALNAVIWPTNDINHWVKGYGWCDLQLALWMPLETLNAAAVCAVMQNIADQVSVLRASALTRKEKRRKHIIQALIIFPVPVLQVVLYYFAIAMRYNISGVIGCQAVFVANWVFLVFFLIPCPIFAVGAAYFAGLCLTLRSPSSTLICLLTLSNVQASRGGVTNKSTRLSVACCTAPASMVPTKLKAPGPDASSTSWR